MSTAQRPWYANDRATEEWKTVGREGGNLRVLKALKILRAIVVNVAIFVVSVYSILEGAEPTVIGSLGLMSLAAYNGIELADYGSLLQALNELANENNK